LRAERGISGPLIVFLGVRRPYKGFNLLLDAARRLPSTVTVAFVGPGAEIDTDVAGGARIIDAGPVDDARKAAWLDAADLYCLPSEGEIFPVSILEAWSAATPILVSDIPPLRELVTRTGGGRAVQRDADVLARSINELLAAPEELASMGERGFAAWKRDFTVEAIAGWYAEEYARVVGEHNGRAAGASLGSRV
jgi:rhamnosyl/mannosyltransferase